MGFLQGIYPLKVTEVFDNTCNTSYVPFTCVWICCTSVIFLQCVMHHMIQFAVLRKLQFRVLWHSEGCVHI